MTSGATLIKISLLIVVLASVACSKKGTSSASAMAPVNVSSGNNNTTLPIQITGPTDDSDPDVIVTLPPSGETSVTVADNLGAPPTTSPAPEVDGIPTEPASTPVSPSSVPEASLTPNQTTEQEVESILVINIINPIVIVTASEDYQHLLVDCADDETLLYSTVSGTDVVALTCVNRKAHVPVARGCYLVKDHKPGRPAKICMKDHSKE